MGGHSIVRGTVLGGYSIVRVQYWEGHSIQRGTVLGGSQYWEGHCIWNSIGRITVL